MLWPVFPSCFGQSHSIAKMLKFPVIGRLVSVTIAFTQLYPSVVVYDKHPVALRHVTCPLFV